MYQIIGDTVQWHMIGHLQRNKVKKAVKIFDMIETIDSVELAEAVNNRCALEGKIMPVLIEINSGKENLLLKDNQIKLLKPMIFKKILDGK